MVKKNHLQINLDDGNKISINSEKSDIKIFLADSLENIFSFNSSEIKALAFFDEHDNPLNYLREQISNDSSTDEVLDTCESIKDAIKQIYRENPQLIDYRKNIFQKRLSQNYKKIEQNNDTPSRQQLFVWGVVSSIILLLLADLHENIEALVLYLGWLIPVAFFYGAISGDL